MALKLKERVKDSHETDLFLEYFINEEGSFALKFSEKSEKGEVYTLPEDKDRALRLVYVCYRYLRTGKGAAFQVIDAEGNEQPIEIAHASLGEDPRLVRPTGIDVDLAIPRTLITIKNQDLQELAESVEAYFHLFE